MGACGGDGLMVAPKAHAFPPEMLAELGYRTRTVDEILGPTVEWLREAGHIRKLSAPSRMC